MIYLERLINETLSNDPELVGLITSVTGFPLEFPIVFPSNLPIYTGFSNKTFSTPCVVFWDESTFNVVPDINELKRTTIVFASFVRITDEVTFNGWETRGQVGCKRIIARVQELFSPSNQANGTLSNSQVKIKSTMFRNRLPVRYENDTDVFRGDVVFQFVWHRI